MYRAISALIVLCGTSVALAQDATTTSATPTPTPAPAPAEAKKAPASWSSPDFEAAGKMLIGSWKTSAPVKQGDAAQSTDVVVNIAHVGIEGMPNALYVEAARLDAMHKPFRQAVWQFYKKGDKTRMRTMEFRRADGEFFPATGAWAVPDAFPAIDPKDLIGTLDMDITTGGGKVSGKTPYPYPTARNGAVEMTSEFSVSADSMETIDRGLAADGKVVWGSGQGEKYTFAKFQSAVKGTIASDGLALIDYARPTTGDAAQPNGRIAVHYTGSLVNGKIHDTTRERTAPYILTVGSPMPMGIARALEGVKKGDLRRAVIPAALGFGEQGNRRAGIPPNATLFYELEIMDVEPPPPAPAVDPNNPNMGAPIGPGGPQPALAPDGSNVKITPIDPSQLPFDPSKIKLPEKKQHPEQPKTDPK